MHCLMLQSQSPEDLLLQKSTSAFIDFTMEYHPKSEKAILQIRRQQEVDAVIKQVARYCLDGWPEKKKLPRTSKSLFSGVCRALSCEGFVDEKNENSYPRIHVA